MHSRLRHIRRRGFGLSMRRALKEHQQPHCKLQGELLRKNGGGDDEK
jgi:hypothetical protein